MSTGSPSSNPPAAPATPPAGQPTPPTGQQQAREGFTLWPPTIYRQRVYENDFNAHRPICAAQQAEIQRLEGVLTDLAREIGNATTANPANAAERIPRRRVEEADVTAYDKEVRDLQTHFEGHARALQMDEARGDGQKTAITQWWIANGLKYDAIRDNLLAVLLKIRSSWRNPGLPAQVQTMETRIGETFSNNPTDKFPGGVRRGDPKTPGSTAPSLQELLTNLHAFRGVLTAAHHAAPPEGRGEATELREILTRISAEPLWREFQVIAGHRRPNELAAAIRVGATLPNAADLLPQLSELRASMESYLYANQFRREGLSMESSRMRADRGIRWFRHWVYRILLIGAGLGAVGAPVYYGVRSRPDTSRSAAGASDNTSDTSKTGPAPDASKTAPKPAPQSPAAPQPAPPPTPAKIQESLNTTTTVTPVPGQRQVTVNIPSLPPDWSANIYFRPEGTQEWHGPYPATGTVTTVGVPADVTATQINVQVIAQSPAGRASTSEVRVAIPPAL